MMCCFSLNASQCIPPLKTHTYTNTATRLKVARIWCANVSHFVRQTHTHTHQHSVWLSLSLFCFGSFSLSLCLCGTTLVFSIRFFIILGWRWARFHLPVFPPTLGISQSFCSISLLRPFSTTTTTQLSPFLALELGLVWLVTYLMYSFFPFFLFLQYPAPASFSLSHNIFLFLVCVCLQRARNIFQVFSLA